jgi:hypothetical protein
MRLDTADLKGPKILESHLGCLNPQHGSYEHQGCRTIICAFVQWHASRKV